LPLSHFERPAEVDEENRDPRVVPESAQEFSVKPQESPSPRIVELSLGGVVSTPVPPSSPIARPPLSDITDHYERYPFPGEGRIVVPTPARFFRDRLSFLLQRRPPEWLSARSRIWVAGCGTQQACHIALSFPNGEIVATDVSEHALSRSRELAKQLGLENIRFEQDDLECSAFSSEFDLVVATGVVRPFEESTVA